MPIFKRANQLIDNADCQITHLSQLAKAVLADVREAVAEAQDGVTITLHKKGEHSLFDFFMGKCDTLPISAVFTLNEPDDKKGS